MMRKAYLSRIIFDKLVGGNSRNHFNNLLDIAVSREMTLIQMFGEIYDEQCFSEYIWIENHLESVEKLCYYFLYGNGELEYRYTNERQRKNALKCAYDEMRSNNQCDYELDNYVRNIGI